MLLGGLTAVAAVLRVVGLDSELWYDEIKTLVEYVRKPLPEIVTQYSKSNHILYTVLAHASLSLFGDHPWSLRLPAMLFGVLSVPALYALGVLMTSRLEACLAAGLLAVSYHHIWFSQDARGYTALVFWSLVTSICLLRGLQEERVGWPIAYGITAVLGIYTHVSMLFLVATQLLLSIVRPWEREKPSSPSRFPVVAGTLVTVLSVLLYAPVAMELFSAFHPASPDPQVQVATFHWALREAFQGLSTGLGLSGTILCCLLAALGCWCYWKQRRLLAALFVLPGLLMAASLATVPSPMRPRFFFMFVGFGFLMAARGAWLAAGWIFSRWPVRDDGHLTQAAGACSLVGVLMLANLVSLEFLYQHPKQSYQAALQYLDTVGTDEDAVVTAGFAVMPYRDYYGRTWQGIATGDELHAAGAHQGRVWMVYSLLDYVERPLASLIEQKCPPVQSFGGTLRGGEVVVCRLRSRTSETSWTGNTEGPARSVSGE